MEKELCTSPGMKIWKISTKGSKQKRWLGLREKMGMLVLSHYKLKLSRGGDTLLSQNRKMLHVLAIIRHWKGLARKGRVEKRQGAIEPSEQGLPYEYRHFIRLYELADLISIAYGECTGIEHDSEDHRFSVQPGEMYLRLKFARKEEKCTNEYDILECQRHHLLQLRLKIFEEVSLLAGVLQRFRDYFRVPFLIHPDCSYQCIVRTPTFLLEPDSCYEEIIKEDVYIACFPYCLRHTYPRLQLLASLATIVIQPFLPRKIAMVKGPCGAGKSVLAAQVCHHPSVHEIFEDRIFWVTIGKGVGNQYLRLLEVLQKLATGLYSVALTKKAVGEAVQRPLKFQTIVQALNWIREVVSWSKLPYLVVADDVWECEVVEILFQTQCSLVVTSPDCSHIGGIGAEQVDVGSMGEEDASALAGMTDPRDVWRGVGTLPLALKQSSIIASFLSEWKEFWFKFENAKKALLENQVLVNAVINQQKCCSRNILENGDITPLIIVTSVALSTAGELLNGRNMVLTYIRGTKVCGEEVVDIQALYAMLAAIPFGLAIPKAVLQAMWFGSSPGGIAAAEQPNGIRDVISALESFLLLQRIYEADGTELYHVNHIQSIYIRALAETRAPLIRVAHMRLKEYLGTIPALLGLGCRNHLSDFEYIVQWPVELYGGLSRYGILDALVTNIDGLTFDVLACQYQEMLDNVTACQQDGDSNRNGLLDRNPFPLAATLASISDVLCMPSAVAATQFPILSLSKSDDYLKEDNIEPSKVPPAFKGYRMALELLEKKTPFCDGGGSDPEGKSLVFYREQGKVWFSIAETLAKVGSINYARMLYQRAIELYLGIAWKGYPQHELVCQNHSQSKHGRVFHSKQYYRRRSSFHCKREPPVFPEKECTSLNLAAGNQPKVASWELDVAFCCMNELGHIVSVARSLLEKGDHSSANALLERGLSVYQVLPGESHPLTMLARKHVCIAETVEHESQSQNQVQKVIANHPHNDMMVPSRDTLAMLSSFTLAPRRPGAAMSLLELTRYSTTNSLTEHDSREKRSGLVKHPAKNYEKILAYGYLIACAAKHLEEERLSQNGWITALESVRKS